MLCCNSREGWCWPYSFQRTWIKRCKYVKAQEKTILESASKKWRCIRLKQTYIFMQLMQNGTLWELLSQSFVRKWNVWKRFQEGDSHCVKLMNLFPFLSLYCTHYERWWFWRWWWWLCWYWGWWWWGEAKVGLSHSVMLLQPQWEKSQQSVRTSVSRNLKYFTSK